MSLKIQEKTGASLVEMVLPPFFPLFHFADSKDTAKESVWSVVSMPIRNCAAICLAGGQRNQLKFSQIEK